MNDEDKLLFLHGLNTVMFCLYSNTQISLQLLASFNFDVFFNKWISFTNLPTVFDKKMSVIGLVSLLELPFDYIPNIIKNNLQQYYQHLFTLADETINERKKYEEMKQCTEGKVHTFDTNTNCNLNENNDYVQQNDVDDFFDDYDFDDFDDSFYDYDEEDYIELQELPILINTLKRIVNGDLKDSRHLSLIQNFSDDLKNKITTCLNMN